MAEAKYIYTFTWTYLNTYRDMIAPFRTFTAQSNATETPPTAIQGGTWDDCDDAGWVKGFSNIRSMLSWQNLTGMIANADRPPEGGMENIGETIWFNDRPLCCLYNRWGSIITPGFSININRYAVREDGWKYIEVDFGTAVPNLYSCYNAGEAKLYVMNHPDTGTLYSYSTCQWNQYGQGSSRWFDPEWIEPNSTKWSDFDAQAQVFNSAQGKAITMILYGKGCRYAFRTDSRHFFEGWNSGNVVTSGLYEYTNREEIGGGYPVPTSLIPLRDTINHPGVNYRRTLVVYDETNYKNRNMFLTNKVGEIPYKLIDFVSPNGTLRVNTNLQFTHFIGPSFTSDWTPRVYRVTSYRTISKDVMEYDFTIDGLKDYWQHFGVTDENAPLCLRTTDASSWVAGETNMMDDSALYKGTISATNYNLTILPYANLPGSDAVTKAWYLVSFANGNSYVMDEFDYSDLTRTIKSDANGALMASSISGVYLVPPNQYISGFTEQTSSITVSGPDGATCTVTFSFNSCHRFTGEATSSAGGRATSRYYMDIPQTDIYSNWYEKSAQWEMYVPFYGVIRPSTQLLQDINEGDVRLFAYIDPVSGMIALEGNNYGVMGEFISLPSVPVPSAASNYYAVQNLETQTKQSLGKGAIGVAGGLIAAGAGIATGNVVIAAGGIGSIGSSLVNSGFMLETNKNQREQLAAGSYSTYSGGGGTSSLCSNTIKLSRYLPDLIIDLEDYYDNVGYPNNRLWKDTGAVSGKRYWITFLGEIKGTTEYKNLVTSDIQSEAIVYNY